MNQFRPLEEVDVQYVQYVLLSVPELKDAAKILRISDSTLYRVRRSRNLLGPLPRSLSLTFPEFLQHLENGTTLSQIIQKFSPPPPPPSWQRPSTPPLT